MRTSFNALYNTLREVRGSLTSLANQYRENAGDDAYGLFSLFDRTGTSSRSQIS